MSRQKSRTFTLTIEEYTSALLPLINLCLVEQARNPTSFAKTQLWFLYRQAFYGFIEFVDWESHCKVSKKALAHFRVSHPSGDLRQFRWFEQDEFNPGGNKSIFFLEHVYTGDMFRDVVNSLTAEQRTIEQIVNLVHSEYCVAWILREENVLLPRSRRGKTLNDALRIYLEQGIELM